MINFSTIEIQSDGSWLFSWEEELSGRVILNGVEIDTLTDATSYTFSYGGYDTYPPAIEIVEDEELALSEVNIPRLLIQWYPVVDCSGYVVQQYEDGSWKDLATKSEENNGQNVIYSYLTDVLEDDEEQNFRVVSIDEYEQESTAVVFRVKIVRCPDVPDENLSVTCVTGTLSIL